MKINEKEIYKEKSTLISIYMEKVYTKIEEI